MLISRKTKVENFRPKKLKVRWDESIRSVFHDQLKMPEPTYGYEAEEVFPIERPEGIPQGVEECVIDSWYPKERGSREKLKYLDF